MDQNKQISFEDKVANKEFVRKYSKEENGESNKKEDDHHDFKKDKKSHKHKHIALHPIFQKLEDKSDFPALYILGTIGLFFTLIIFNFLPLHMANIAAICFGSYWTFKSMENPEKDDDKQWLMYWTLFFGFLSLDMLIPGLLKMIPYFYLIKFVFFTWLFLPITNGARRFHDRIFEKYFGTFNMDKVYKLTDKIKSKFSIFTDKLLDKSREGEEMVDRSELTKDKKDMKNEEMNKNIPKAPILLKKKREHEEELSKESLKQDEKLEKPIKQEISKEEDTINKKQETVKQEERFVPEKMEKVMETKPNKEQMTMQDEKKDKRKEQTNEKEHESRQNIVGDAKIATDQLKTNLQNVHTQLNETVQKLKSKTSKEIPKEDVFDQKKLTSQAKDISSTYRTNQDPHFNKGNSQEFPAVDKEIQISEEAEKTSERVITPHEDRIINKKGDDITSAYPITKELQKGTDVKETKLLEDKSLNKEQPEMETDKKKRRHHNKGEEEKKVM
jgi:receptor expression-enhancing protein 5/6